MNCSDVTAADVDQEVMAILKRSYEEAKRLLGENRDVMDKIAEFLIQKETITGKEFMKIFREVKGIPEPEEDEEQKSERVTEKKAEEPAGDQAVKEEAEPSESEETIKENETVVQETVETATEETWEDETKTTE